MSGENLVIRDSSIVEQSKSPFDKNTWRWVRRKPLFVDNRDGSPVDKGRLFGEYVKKCEVALHTGELGDRQMVIVDPEVRSRKDKHFSPQAEFEETYLLYLNLKEALRGHRGDLGAKMNLDDLKRIYPGKSVPELQIALAEKLGNIFYGTIAKKEPISRYKTPETGVVVRGAAPQIQVVEAPVIKINYSTRKNPAIRVLGACGAMIVLLTACSRIPVSTPTAAEATKPPEKTSLPTSFPPAEPTVTKEAPQVTPTYVVEAAGGTYTEAQLALNSSESAIKQIEAQDRYLEYWSKFMNRPFDPETVELKRKFVYDDPNNSTEVLVLLEALGEYNGRTFTVPIGAGGQFAEYPPEVSGDNIEPGFGPLELSGGADGQWLSVENGIPVRRNSAGEIVEKLNMETKQWEVVERVVIDFEVPLAPVGVEQELWNLTYVKMMTESVRVKNLVQAGTMTLQWDQGLKTMVGTFGEESFAYNQEFGFTGEIVKDTYGRNWIVREKLSMSQSDTGSIWDYDRLHILNSGELVLGAQSKSYDFGDDIAVVGQVVGREKVDLSPYLSDNFASMTEDEAGIFYGGKNLVYEVMVVRVPTSNGFVDLKVPICPVDYCSNSEMVTNFLRGHGAGIAITGEKMLEEVDLGSAVYLNYKNYTNESAVSKSFWVDAYKKYKVQLSNSRAFGNGDLNYGTLSQYFDLGLSGNYISDIFGIPSIFDLEKLSEENYTTTVVSILY